jgi:hypothetical protein
MRVGFLLLFALAAAPLGAAKGGPDSFGYTWEDSAISVPVVQHVFDSVPSSAFPAQLEWLSDEEILPFEFFFYGKLYTSVWISDNGWISFVPPSDPHPVPAFMPTSGEPVALAAALWENLQTNRVWWGPILEGTGFMIRYDSMQPQPPSGVSAQFDICLYDDGRIRYTYLKALDTGGTAVGVEDETETHGMTLLFAGTDYDDFSIDGNYAVEFYPPNNLDCAGAVAVSCGDSLDSSLPGTGTGEDARHYSCSTEEYGALERVFELEIDRVLEVQAALSGFAPRDLSLFLLDECGEQHCLEGGGPAVQQEILSGKTLYLSVDGLEQSDEGPFHLDITCSDPHTQLDCGELRSAELVPGTGHRDVHRCAAPGADHRGADHVYYVCIQDPTTVRFFLDAPPDVQVIAYRGGIELNQCESWGATEATIFGADVGCHYAYVDGPDGSAGPYEITASCEPYLDCGDARPLACGETVAGDTWAGPGNLVSFYSCTGIEYDGPENVWLLDNPEDQTVSLVLDDPDTELDLLLLDDGRCDEGFCLFSSDDTINAVGLPAGTYPVVVDGRFGAGGDYSITTYCGRSIEPESVEAWLSPGEVVDEHKTVTLTPDIPRGDVMFAIDLTGSMGEELLNLQIASKEIINQISRVVSDLHFGLIGFQDYPGEFPPDANCGYDRIYGASFDEPYDLVMPLGGDVLEFESAVDSLSLGHGSDEPEAYARLFYEALNDDQIGWRAGSRRLLVALGDSYAHDCDVGACLGQPNNVKGRDPGRDGVVGTPDDVEIMDILGQMGDAGLALLYFDSSDGNNRHAELWECWAGITGGSVQVLNPDGTIPGGVDLAALILSAIKGQASYCGVLTLVPSAGFEDWLVSIDPAQYYNMMLPQVVEYEIQLGPPPGTPDGLYVFTVDAVCDGAVVAQQQVTIHVGPCDVTAVAPDDLSECEGFPIALDGSASTVSGCAGEAQYQWSRDGQVIRPWGPDKNAADTVGSSPATYTIEARCFGDPNCGLESSDSFLVTPLPDDIPPPLGDVLVVARSGMDLELNWDDFMPPGAISTYQVLVHDGSAQWPPDPATLESAPVVGEQPQAAPTYRHTGAIESPCELPAGSSPCRLLCYQVRATSPCSATPGSACDGFPRQVPCP